MTDKSEHPSFKTLLRISADGKRSNVYAWVDEWEQVRRARHPEVYALIQHSDRDAEVVDEELESLEEELFLIPAEQPLEKAKLKSKLVKMKKDRKKLEVAAFNDVWHNSTEQSSREYIKTHFRDERQLLDADMNVAKLVCFLYRTHVTQDVGKSQSVLHLQEQVDKHVLESYMIPFDYWDRHTKHIDALVHAKKTLDAAFTREAWERDPIEVAKFVRRVVNDPRVRA